MTDEILSLATHPEFVQKLPGEATRNWLLPLFNLGFVDSTDTLQFALLPGGVNRSNGYADAIADSSLPIPWNGQFSFGFVVAINGAKIALIEGFSAAASGVGKLPRALATPSSIGLAFAGAGLAIELSTVLFDPNAYTNGAAVGGIVFKSAVSTGAGAFATLIVATAAVYVGAPAAVVVIAGVIAGGSASFVASNYLDRWLVAPFRVTQSYPAQLGIPADKPYLPWSRPHSFQSA